MRKESNNYKLVDFLDYKMLENPTVFCYDICPLTLVLFADLTNGTPRKQFKMIGLDLAPMDFGIMFIHFPFIHASRPTCARNSKGDSKSIKKQRMPKEKVAKSCK